MFKQIYSYAIIFIMMLTAGFAQNPLGNGSDEVLIVNTGDLYNTDNSRTSITGTNTSGSNSIIAADATYFSTGDEVLIITMQDPQTDLAQNVAGQYEFKTITAIAGTEITLNAPLENTYDAATGAKHQIIKIMQFSNVTINGTLTCSKWNGTTGGVLIFRASGTVTINEGGVITASETGYRGGKRGGPDGQWHGLRGESYVSFAGGQSRSAYYNGGGGGIYNYGGSGGGAGNAYSGTNAEGSNNGYAGGAAFTETWKNLMLLGGGGGGGAGSSDKGYGGSGGAGGGILCIYAREIFNYGTIESNGSRGNWAGESGVWNPFPLYSYHGGAGGSGAGGYIGINAEFLTNQNRISCDGGIGYNGHYGKGGNGSVGHNYFDITHIQNLGDISPQHFDPESQWGIVHEKLQDTPNTSAPYIITANITDIQGDNIVSAKIFYSLNGSDNYSQVLMSTSDGTLFAGNIPAKSINTVIDYYISATDGNENYMSPYEAPDRTLSFRITGYPPTALTATNNGDGNVTLNWTAPVDLSNFVSYTIYRSLIEEFTPSLSNKIAENIIDVTYNDLNLDDSYTYHYIIEAKFNFNNTTNTNRSDYATVLVNNTSETTVKGFAFLEGQSNPANIKITFVPISFSAVEHIAYTDPLGYFETVINPGVYHIRYDKDGYQSNLVRADLSIIDNLDLGEENLTLLGSTFAGNVSGNWDGIYTIDGNITVPNGDTLIIGAGSIIRFLGNYNLYVHGYLEVNGAEGDSVLFTSLPETQDYAAGQWQGIDLYDDADDNSYISHAIIRYAVDGIYWDNCNADLSDSHIFKCSDNGLDINNGNCYPNITNVELHNNSNNGIYVYRGSPRLTNVYSHHNSSYGVYWKYWSYGTITDCKFNENTSHGIRFYEGGSPSITNTEIKHNKSWGARIDYHSSPTFTECDISYNSGYGARVNNDNNNWCTVRFRNCLVEYNTSHGLSLYRHLTWESEVSNCLIQHNGSIGIYTWYRCNPKIFNNRVLRNNGVGIYFNDNVENDLHFHHNIIAHNNGDGMHKRNNNGSCLIEYNTIYNNNGDGIEINNATGTKDIRHNIIINNEGWGIRNNETVHVFNHNNIYENKAGAILELTKMPVDTWKFVSENANSDSADVYLNISIPAEFNFTDSLDFSLKSVSNCIDAGNVNEQDPDGTAPDLGAIYYDAGNPQGLEVVNVDNASVGIKWDMVENLNLLNYKVYYKLNTADNFTFFADTDDISVTVTGLANNVLYDFSIAVQYTGSTSRKANLVSATPGVQGIDFNPVAFNITVDTETNVQTLVVSNIGTKELDIFLPEGGKPNSARFDGSGDYLNVGDQPHLSGMSAFTMECWIKRLNNGHLEFISKNYRRYSLFINSGNRFGMYKGYNATHNLYQSWTTPYVLPENEWHHLAVTWEGNTITFYADGQVVAEYDNAMPNAIHFNGYSFQLGRRADENAQYLNGNLAEVRIWNKVRTQKEINRTMLTPLIGDEAGLMGYWPLRQDYTDFSIYQKNATKYGQTYISGDTPPTLIKIPFILDQTDFTIPVGGSVQVPFQFYDSGQEGTFAYTTPVFWNIIKKQKKDLEISITYGQNVPATPIHFTPVAATGLPYTIVITDAKIDELTIDVGDEIAVFDGETCVGAGIFDGSFNFVLTAWKNDAGQ